MKSTLGRNMNRPSTASRVIGVTGELLVTVGVLIALFVFYQLYWTGVSTARAQSQANDDLRSMWSSSASGDPVPATEVEPKEQHPDWGSIGDPVALLSAEGAGFDELVAFEGVDLATIADGPGHYPDSALPGQVGNSSFAAHRDGNGAPFDNIDRLGTCDDISVETETAVYHYKVLPVDGKAGEGEAFDCVPEGTEVPSIPGRHIVTPDRVDVVEPKGESSLVTFTTCHPRWSNSHRLIIHGVLASVEHKEP